MNKPKRPEVKAPRLGKWVYDTRYGLEFFSFYCLHAAVHQTQFTWNVRRKTANTLVGNGLSPTLREAKEAALRCMKKEWETMGEVLKKMDTSFRGARAHRSKRWNEEKECFE